MANTETALTYQELEQKVKLELAQAVENNKISNENLLAVLFLLGQTSTVLELETFMEIFSDAFPVLKNMDITKRAGIQTNMEDKVRKVVSQLVFTDPKRASDITKAALKKDAKWDELVQEFPELE